MKKLVMLMLVLSMLLSGCGLLRFSGEDTENHTDVTVESVEDTESAELPLPWVDEDGLPWDSDGALTEMPLTIPDGQHYTGCTEFDGDLLLWSFDYHLAEVTIVELCVVELVDGSVHAQRDVTVPGSPRVQVLGDSIYIIDPEIGYIEALAKDLTTIQTWETEPVQGDFYMGAENLYIFDWNGDFLALDLVTGERQSLLAEGAELNYVTCNGDTAIISYYSAGTGAPTSAALDLITGEIVEQPVRGDFGLVTYQDGIWLLSRYTGEYNTYTLVLPGEDPVMIAPGGGTLQLIDGKYLLYCDELDTCLRLYNLSGICISECDLSAEPYSYYVMDSIWSKAYYGYFCTINSYDGNFRLLFWDIEKGRHGESLILEPIPADSETDAYLKNRAQQIGEAYGVTILVSGDCDTVFDEFYAGIADDYYAVNEALDELEAALATYPEGFFRQLRYGSIHGIQIQLVTDLFADGSGRYGDGYIAFAQEKWDYYLVVADIEDVDTEDYYHEFSHIIDSYLEWDSWQREDALFSEETWNSLNPSWFTGYSYDYSVEHDLYDSTSFIDSYSTISPTEDRARIMEYAMWEYGEYSFADADILLAKLAYYSRCIRDAFDTEGWPSRLPWETYLG